MAFPLDVWRYNDPQVDSDLLVAPGKETKRTMKTICFIVVNHCHKKNTAKQKVQEQVPWKTNKEACGIEGLNWHNIDPQMWDDRHTRTTLKGIFKVCENLS